MLGIRTVYIVSESDISVLFSEMSPLVGDFMLKKVGALLSPMIRYVTLLKGAYKEILTIRPSSLR